MNRTHSIAIASMLFATTMLTNCTQAKEDIKSEKSLQAEDQTTLADISNIGDGFSFDTKNVTLEPTNESQQVVFKASKSDAALTFIPETPWNVSSEDNIELAIQIENPTDQPINVFFIVKDRHGNTSTRNAHISVQSQNTFYAPLNGPEMAIESGIRSNPEPYETDDILMIRRSGARELDLTSIASVSIETKGTISDKTLIIGDLIVRKSPAIKDDYMKNFVDPYGQNAKVDFARKITSDAQLKAAADAELETLAQTPTLPDRSKFGGWKDGPQLEATGYFRTEKIDGKWWMVDPEGYLFFSNGIANVRMANTTTLTGIDYKDPDVRYRAPDDVTPEDSKDLAKAPEKALKTAYVASDLRRDMFTWLPDYDHELSDHYSYRKSAMMGPLEHGETYSFYQANLERRYGDEGDKSYLKKWRQVTLDRMKAWGFTSFGNWVADELYTNEQVPYFANGWVIGNFKTISSGNDYWGPMPDVFDPVFDERVKDTIRVIAEEVQASPWCIGIFIDNEKSWGSQTTLEGRYGLIIDALSKNATNSPAKAKFVELLQAKYTDIDALNDVWKSDLASWDDFASGYEIDMIDENIREDVSMLLEEFSRKYFKTVHDTLEKALPDHLYMGVRMASWSMPPEAVTAALEYSDVLSFNVYKEGLLEEAWDFLNDLDMPSLVGEFHMGSLADNGLLHPGLIAATTQAERGDMYKRYLKTALDHPNMVGVHWFQYIDSPLTGRAYDGENYNVGFVSVTDQPYPELVEAAKEVNTTLYPYRYGKSD